MIVWHAVTVLIDRSSHPDLEIFRVFDEAIGMLVRFTGNALLTHFDAVANPLRRPRE